MYKAVMKQQGDVIVMRIPKDKMPKDGVKVPGSVLAEGEVTGHFHGFEKNVKVMEKDGIKYFEISKMMGETKLKHQEHKPVNFEPGCYAVGIVNEADPFSEDMNRVAD